MICGDLEQDRGGRFLHKTMQRGDMTVSLMVHLKKFVCFECTRKFNDLIEEFDIMVRKDRLKKD